MGAIVKRGTKNKPRFYGQYKDANGVRRTKLLRGATSTETARGMLTAIECNVMQGRLGIEELTEEERARRTITVRQLGEAFIDEKTGYSNPKVKNMREYRRHAKWKLQGRIYARIGARAVPPSERSM